MKKIIALTFIVLISIYGILAFNTRFFESEESSRLKEFHYNLFDLYLPADESLTTVQKLKRVFYREVTWYKIKNNKELAGLLNPLSDLKRQPPAIVIQEFPDIVKNGFENVSPERQDEFRRAIMLVGSPELKKYLFKLRQTWLYIVYSTPLTYDLASIIPKEENKIVAVNLNLPKTKLKVVDNEIINEDGEIDYLIIGSGPAASVIAHELTRQVTGAKVVLVESGSFVKPLSTITEASSNLMESNNDRRTISGGIVIRNGATVGGGTTVNLDLAFSPLLPQIKAKLQGWVDFDRLPADFLHQSNQDWQKLHDAYEWVKSYVHTRQVSAEEINDNNKLLKDGDLLATTYNLNARKPSGKKNEILKISAVEAFILPALRGGDNFKGHLSLLPNAKAIRINFSNNDNDGEKKSTGVSVIAQPLLREEYVAEDINNLKLSEAKEYTIKAKNIIISAGTLGSAELLLKSNINNDNIGRGIIIHPSMGVIGQFAKEINAFEGLSASVYAPAVDGSYFYEAMSDNPQFIAQIHPGSGKDIIHTLQNYRKLGGFGIMLVDSVNYNNRVFIDHNFGKVEVDYTISSADKIRLREGIKTAVKILFQQGAKEVFIPTAENIFGKSKFEPFLSPDNIDKAVEHLEIIDPFNFISSAHMQGSNKIGSDPQNSVISNNFRVWDLPSGKEIANLYVCDSSIFPTSVGANPMQSIYTIAKLFVDRIALFEQTKD
ncbi:GMC oxidoreductase [Candidatus Trichorickettsia mobilis]|uniref:GMC oxidoreductase n=1 Tax=Candidatus Trichorickettsia mobilis TaxID=1346319 RepID=UPI00292D9860|nr:GMC oxidoreductase [Candidatus Trichorickettsia mobilis]